MSHFYSNFKYPEESMTPTSFTSRRAPVYADVPDEKWNDWRWQLSHWLNTTEEIEKVLPLTESERKVLSSSGLFRVDITPYFISLIRPEDPDDPTRKQIIPTAAEMVPFTAMMEDSLAEDRQIWGSITANPREPNSQRPEIRYNLVSCGKPLL
jgi:hypothetical protein